VNFSDVRIVTVGTTDGIGTKRPVQSEVVLFASRMSGGNQRHATQEATAGGGVGLEIDLGTLKPLVSRATLARTETTGHLASTHENGRRNRFASIVTGIQEQKKAVLLGMRSITLYHNMKTLPRPKKLRSRRNRL